MRSSETAGFMAMKGAGYYSKATTGARDVINAATPLILSAVDRMNLQGRRPSPSAAADMGCADGGTSVGMWTPRARPRARSRVPSRPIEMFYCRSAAQRFQPAVSDDPRPDRHPELLRPDSRRVSVRLGHLVPSGDLPARESRPRFLGHGFALHLESAVQHRRSCAHGRRERRGAARLRGDRPHRVGAPARAARRASS